MMDRYQLLGKGLFPEVLPPCFVSSDIKRALAGLIGKLEKKQFQGKRSAAYSRYSGTKHDGNRRLYGTPNPILYLNVCSFIQNNWKTFEGRFKSSPFSISTPRIGGESDDRAIIVPTLSELPEKVSSKIRFAPFVLKADISQFFASIYTHTIPWSAHGVAAAKLDRDKKSKKVRFNKLDFFVQNTQSAQTRGLLVGPDAFRLIAEFIACDIDANLQEFASPLIIGAARHVDDFYIGVKSEVDALTVLSHLREVLQSYELQVNDAKTKIISGLEPIDDIWAQEIRKLRIRGLFLRDASNVSHIIDKAVDLQKTLRTESPIKIVLRRFDKEKCYETWAWQVLEPKLQRMLFHFPHCTDYILLLAAKRFATGEGVDVDGWRDAIFHLIARYQALNHHHEIVWLLWFLFVCRIDLGSDMLIQMERSTNPHIGSLLIQAYIDGRCSKKPVVRFQNKLPTTGEDWLLNLVARSTGFTKAPFGDELKEEFEHMAHRNVKIIDFDQHMIRIKSSKVSAISQSRYGYDSDSSPDIDPDPDHEVELGYKPPALRMPWDRPIDDEDF